MPKTQPKTQPKIFNPQLLVDRTIVVPEALACEVGLDEAIILQTVHYELTRPEHLITSAQFKTYKSKRWIYRTIEEWQQNCFSFWTESTVLELFDKLIAQQLLKTTGAYLSDIYITVNYQRLNSMSGYTSATISQNDKTREPSSAQPTKKLYLISNGQYTKIGISQDVKKRLNGLQTSNPRPLTILAQFPIFEPAIVEEKIHKHFEDKRTHGEWFELSQHDIEVIKKYLEGTKAYLKNTKTEV